LLFVFLKVLIGFEHLLGKYEGLERIFKESFKTLKYLKNIKIFLKIHICSCRFENHVILSMFSKLDICIELVKSERCEHIFSFHSYLCFCRVKITSTCHNVFSVTFFESVICDAAVYRTRISVRIQAPLEFLRISLQNTFLASLIEWDRPRFAPSPW